MLELEFIPTPLTQRQEGNESRPRLPEQTQPTGPVF